MTIDANDYRGNGVSATTTCPPVRRLRGIVLLAALTLTTLLLCINTAFGQTQPDAAGRDAAATGAAAAPGDALVTSGLDASGAVRLVTDKSTVLTTSRPYRRLSVAQPDVADVNGISPTRILLTAKKAGTTQLIIWDEQDRSQVVDIYVTMDVAPLREQYSRLFPGSRIDVVASGNSVILSGRVPNLQTADQAAAIAAPSGQGRVVNLLEVSGGQQVMLQVRFAEVSRSATSSLGVNFGFTDGPSFFGSNVGQVSPLGIKEVNNNSVLAIQSPNPSVTIFGKGEVGNTAFAYFINALRQNNLLRILAEPNLIAISGQEASFLAGGEYPIPVTQAGGSAGGTAAITIEYRQFGVRLNFVPVVLGDGRIRLKCAPEVSDLDFSTAVVFNGYVVPGLTSRKVSTTVELADGQSFAIAGLLNNSTLATKNVTPVLGDIPVLGALFRSVRYQRKETELLVIVTPRLVAPLNPGQMPMLPGETWRHPSETQLFLGQDLGGPAATADDAAAGTTGTATATAGATTRPAAGGAAAAAASPAPARPAGPAPRFYGQYGFVPATRPVAAAK